MFNCVSKSTCDSQAESIGWPCHNLSSLPCDVKQYVALSCMYGHIAFIRRRPFLNEGTGLSITQRPVPYVLSCRMCFCSSWCVTAVCYGRIMTICQPASFGYLWGPVLKGSAAPIALADFKVSSNFIAASPKFEQFDWCSYLPLPLPTLFPSTVYITQSFSELFGTTWDHLAVQLRPQGKGHGPGPGQARQPCMLSLANQHMHVAAAGI